MPWALLAVALVFLFFAGAMTVIFTQAARFSGRPLTMLDRVRLILGLAPLFGIVGMLIVMAMRTQGLIAYDSRIDTVGSYGLFACVACLLALHVVRVRQMWQDRHRPPPPYPPDDEPAD